VTWPRANGGRDDVATALRALLDARSPLIVVAHPDDETIGAGAMLAELRNPLVVHLTDGAPGDRQLVSPHFDGPREVYAAARAAEARAALAVAGVTRIRPLGVNDQEASFDLESLMKEVDMAMRDADVVVTCAYEGGHPDHDACALAVHAAARIRGAPIVEMALYHARDGAFVAGEFLDGEEGEVVDLTADQRARKQRMFDCYATQRDVLEQFPIGRERFRMAPHYDFTMRPHDGPLWYEILGWPMTGTRWRQLAAEALGVPCAS
jgi:LmbE family N-acetylglucosaminyl deacetylase